ncbi:MAG: hypothetical protein JOY54_00875 [Acidobacteriaceae bacterium]|nr:hypothetical protein [Acidobacteriaceae bacterium]
MASYKPLTLNREEINIPSAIHVERTCQLPRRLSAVHLEPGPGDGSARLGAIETLPEGTPVEVCGAGYNDRTVKIRCHGQYYFVFQVDLDSEPIN